ncbi:hypothetical protein AAMO2058_000411500 [Amorphochlora amoebiformis]
MESDKKKEAAPRMTADARDLCAQFTTASYARMKADTARVQAYERAIKIHAKGKVVLDIGVGGDALLAIMCVRAGAKKVYGVEVNRKSAVAAEATVQKLGLKNKIEILKGYSTDLKIPTCDLVVHEIIGNIASREGVALAIYDIYKRGIIPPNADTKDYNKRSIPQKSSTFIAPACMPGDEYWETHPRILAPPENWPMIKFEGFPWEDSVISKEFKLLEEIRFDAMPNLKPDPVSLNFNITKDSLLLGFIAYITVTTHTGIMVSSKDANSSWANPLLLLPKPLEVKKGEIMTLEAKIEMDTVQPRYTFKLCSSAEVEGESKGASCFELTFCIPRS